MLIKESRNLVNYEGIDSADIKQFGVEFNATLFNLLTDKVYSDKVLAVQRELSTNAVDSHIEAGHTKPFDIKLPSRFEPTYIIRDYGVGLTPEQVTNIYTVLGKSNRNTDNRFNGCMGIGSKAFLGYGSKAGIIESFVNGMHRTYSVHLGEKGIPECAKLAEQPTNEPTGVKITINVEPHDCQNFVVAAEQLYPYFQIKPNFIGGTKPKIKDVKYVLSGTSWKVRDTSNDYYNRQCKAVMANIAYPVIFDDTGLDQKYRSLMNCPIDIFFDTGALAIAPSREALSYDARTKTAIQLKFKEVLAEIYDLVHDKIKNSKNLWEARINFIKIKDTIDQNILSVIGLENIEFNNKKLFDGHYGLNIPQDISMLQFEYRQYYSRNKTYKKDSHHIYLADTTGWFYDDLKTGSHIRCRNALETNVYPNIVLFNFKDGNGNQDQSQRDKLVEFLGCEDSMILPVSSLVKPATVATIRTGKGSSTKVVLLKKDGDYRKSYCWENTTKNLDDGGYYVEVNTFDIMDGTNSSVHPNVLSRCGKILEELGETIPDVYGIKTAHIAKLAKAPNTWTNYLEYIRNIIKKYNKQINSKEVEDAQENYNLLGRYDSRKYQYLITEDILNKLSKLVNKDSIIITLKEEIDRVKTILTKKTQYKNLVTIADNLGVTLNSISSSYTKSNIKTLMDDMYQKYPLLYCIEDKFINDFANYVNMVDA